MRAINQSAKITHKIFRKEFPAQFSEFGIIPKGFSAFGYFRKVYIYAMRLKNNPENFHLVSTSFIACLCPASALEFQSYLK
jgi:hypothetical protein